MNVFSLMVFAGDCECVLTDGVCRRLNVMFSMCLQETVNVFSLMMVFAGDCERVLTDGVCRRL